MLKKNEVIEVLKAGGYIYMKGQPQSAYVYSVSDGLLGRCRHDMALRLAAMDEYETIRDEDGGTWYRICDPVAVNAEKAAAWHELNSIRTPGRIEIQAKNDCRIGGQYVAKGRRYVITVYGDGTQEQPGNAYGKLYDFRTHEHAVYFEIISRPEADDLAAQSARVEAETREALARAGMLAEEAPAEEIAPAEEAPAPREPKQYARADGSAATRSASEALSWHRAGHDIIVAAPGKSAVYIHGAPQEAERQDDENRAHCKRIALELDAYVNGEIKRCPDCGEIHRRDWGDVGDAFRCPNCGEVASVDDWEWLWVYDFLSDALDVEYIVSGRARDSLRAVRVMVAYGGPTIYIDTDTGHVELYWWTERARYALSSYAIDAVNEWAGEMWACL
jgi:predicted RNA-binding Zn-ribbon protein involved in translation (DUF1610 family)